MKNTQKVNLEEGTGSILSRFFRLKISRITLLMNLITSILSHLLQCIHLREFVISQDMRHHIMIQGLTCVMPMLKYSSSSGHFLMTMCSVIWLLEMLLLFLGSFASFNGLLFSYFLRFYHLRRWWMVEDVSL